MFFCRAMPTRFRTEGAGVGVVGGDSGKVEKKTLGSPCLYLEPKGPLFFDTSQKRPNGVGLVKYYIGYIPRYIGVIDFWKECVNLYPLLLKRHGHVNGNIGVNLTKYIYADFSVEIFQKFP